MSVILIVDDDKNFLLSLVEGLRAHDNGFEIKTAENGKMAAEAIRDESVDLVITDLKMPETDGFELLAYMSSNYPRIPVIVMTAYGTPLIENSVTNLGAIRYVEKPLDFDLLLEHIYKSIELSESTYAPGIPLVTFLKLLNLEKKTCVLTVHYSENGNETEGKMFFKRGVLIDAATASKKGEGAAMEILGWERAAIKISTQPFTAEKNIQNDLDFLIMVSQSRTAGQRANQAAASPAASYDNIPDNIFNMETSDAFSFQNLDAEEWIKEGTFSDGGQPSASGASDDGQRQEPDNRSNMFSSSENVFSEETAPYGEESAATPPGANTDDSPNAFPEDDLRKGTSDTEPAAVDGNAVSYDKADDSLTRETYTGTINIRKMNDVLAALREMTQEGLLSCDICDGKDGQSIAGYNSNPVYCAASALVIQNIKNSIINSNLPPLGNTCIIDLEEEKMAIIVIIHDYLWNILIDTSKCPLGLFLNVTLPKVKAIFKEALSK